MTFVLNFQVVVAVLDSVIAAVAVVAAEVAVVAEAAVVANSAAAIVKVVVDFVDEEASVAVIAKVEVSVDAAVSAVVIVKAEVSVAVEAVSAEAAEAEEASVTLVSAFTHLREDHFHPSICLEREYQTDSLYVGALPADIQDSDLKKLFPKASKISLIPAEGTRPG